MEDCEVRLGLISVVVREQREALGKLKRRKIQLETKREALVKMKEEMTLRGRRVEKAKAFLEGLKADGRILSGVVSADDETMSLVKEELRRQEDLETKRLALETEKMERLVVDISNHKDEVKLVNHYHCISSSPSRWFSLRKRWNTSRLEECNFSLLCFILPLI